MGERKSRNLDATAARARDAAPRTGAARGPAETEAVERGSFDWASREAAPPRTAAARAEPGDEPAGGAVAPAGPPVASPDRAAEEGGAGAVVPDSRAADLARAAEVGARAADSGARAAGSGARAAGQPPRATGGWRSWLAGASPREVLARLMCGDPLELRPRIAAVLDERAYLIEHDRVHLRVAARIARAAPRYRGQPELDLWLRRHLDESLAEMLEDDEESDARGGSRAGAEPSAPWALEELARPLGIEPSSARAACLAFNRLPFEERAAFRALVLEGRSLDDLAGLQARGWTSATEVARAARRALEQVCAAADPPPAGKASATSGPASSSASAAFPPPQLKPAQLKPPSSQPPSSQPPSSQVTRP